MSNFYFNVFDKPGSKYHPILAYEFTTEMQDYFPEVMNAYMKCKSSPGGNTLNQTGEMVRKSNGDNHYRCKTEWERKFWDFHSTKITLASQYPFPFEAHYTGNLEALNKDGRCGSIDADIKYDPLKQFYKGNVGISFGRFKLGPIKSWSQLQFEQQKGNSGLQKDVIHSNTFSTDCEKYHFGYSVRGSVVTNSLRDLYLMALVQATGKGDIWFRCNTQQKCYNLGWFHKCTERFTIGAELMCDTRKRVSQNPGYHEVEHKNPVGAGGYRGTPASAKVGFHYKMNNGTMLKTFLRVNEDLILSNKWEVPVSSNSTVVINDRAYLNKFIKNPSDCDYKLGFGLEFKV